jgi:hypothetical protein
MERRGSRRAQVDLPAVAFVDGYRHRCRAIDLGPLGMVVERPRIFAARELPLSTPFEIELGVRPIRARARPVWTRDRLVAVRFLDMRDVDRLTLAELLDDKRRRGEPLH